MCYAVTKCCKFCWRLDFKRCRISLQRPIRKFKSGIGHGLNAPIIVSGFIDRSRIIKVVDIFLVLVFSSIISHHFAIFQELYMVIVRIISGHPRIDRIKWRIIHFVKLSSCLDNHGIGFHICNCKVIANYIIVIIQCRDFIRFCNIFNCHFNAIDIGHKFFTFKSDSILNGIRHKFPTQSDDCI